MNENCSQISNIISTLLWLDVFEGTTVVGMYPQRDKIECYIILQITHGKKYLT